MALITLKKGILKFNGTEVKFNPALFNYLYLEERFEPVVKETMNSIEKKFDQKIGTMNGYISNIDSFLSSVYAPLCDEAVRQLSQLGCYSYDAESFFRKYVEPKFEKIIEIKEALLEENERIEKTQAVRDSMRTLRRHAAVARDRAQAYRQGKSGDEALLTNIGHGIFNTIAKAGDEASNKKEREKEFRKVKQAIKDELLWIAIDMPGSVAELLHQEVGGEDYRDPRTDVDFQKAENIFKNLKDNNIPESQRDKAAIEVFALNPQLEGFLPWCVKTYGDPEGEFEQAASFFRVDISKTKKDILNSIINIDTEENAIASKGALKEKEIELSISAPELEQKVDMAIAEFDLKYRTVDNVEFETRDEADEARRQLKEKQDLEKIELEKVTELSKEYHLDNPNMCIAFLSAIDSLKLKTSVADEIVKSTKDRLSKQKEILEQIIRRYNISQEDAILLMTKHSVLARSGIAGLKVYNLIDTNTRDQADAFCVPEDDIILGRFNIYNNMKDGILITKKGIYSRYSKKAGCGFAILTLSPACFFFFLFLTSIESGPNMVFFVLSAVLLVFGISALISIKMAFKLYNQKNPAVFTQINDVFFSLSSDKKLLYLNKQSSTTLPLKGYCTVIKEFEKIKLLFRDLQELNQ